MYGNFRCSKEFGQPTLHIITSSISRLFHIPKSWWVNPLTWTIEKIILSHPLLSFRFLWVCVRQQQERGASASLWLLPKESPSSIVSRPQSMLVTESLNVCIWWQYKRIQLIVSKETIFNSFIVAQVYFCNRVSYWQLWMMMRVLKDIIDWCQRNLHLQCLVAQLDYLSQ